MPIILELGALNVSSLKHLLKKKKSEASEGGQVGRVLMPSVKCLNMQKDRSRRGIATCAKASVGPGP